MKAEINGSIDKFLEGIKESEFFRKIEFITLYGSQLSEYHLKDSDIDICIYLREEEKINLGKIRLDLLKALGDEFDIQMFQLLPIYVQIEVLKGRVLYVRDEDELYRIAYETIEEYEDFYPLYEDYINR